MKCGKGIRQPGDTVRLSAACAVLVKIALPGSILLSVGSEFTHTFKLVKAREDLPLSIGLLALVIQYIDHADESLYQIEDSTLLPDILPKVTGRITYLAWGVTRPPVASLIKRQKLRACSGQLRGDVHQIIVHGEVGKASLEAEERFFWVTCFFILFDGVTNVLSRNLVLQF